MNGWTFSPDPCKWGKNFRGARTYSVPMNAHTNAHTHAYISIHTCTQSPMQTHTCTHTHIHTHALPSPRLSHEVLWCVSFCSWPTKRWQATKWSRKQTQPSHASVNLRRCIGPVRRRWCSSNVTKCYWWSMWLTSRRRSVDHLKGTPKKSCGLAGKCRKCANISICGLCVAVQCMQQFFFFLLWIW